jgi:outer membrane protein, heavy metal efflux system
VIFVWIVGATLSVEQVKESVTRYFPLVRAAGIELELMQAELLSADGGFDPAFSARAAVDALGYYRDVQVDAQIEQATPLWGASVIAGYRLGRGAFPSYSGGQETNAYGEVRGAINVPLLRNGWTDRRRAGIERARLGVDVGKAGQAQTLLEVTRAACLRYFAWAGAGQKRELAKNMLSLAKARDGQIEGRVSSGDLPRVERIDNARTIAQREAALIQADRALQQAALDLSLYLRGSDGQPRAPGDDELPATLNPEPLVVDNPSALVERALEVRPEVKRGSLTLRQARVEHDLQKNQLWPALDFRLTMSQDLGPGSATRSPFELTGAVVLEVPLLYRLQRGRERAAAAAVARGETLLQLQRDRIAIEVKDARSAERAASARHAAALREASLAAEAARLERARFDLGESTVLVVNLREGAVVESQARVIDAAVDTYRAQIELAAVSGSLVAPQE